MKIYTRTGDQGTSSLFSGERVRKNHGRMTAYGDVDELNSVIGALLAVLPTEREPLHDQLQGIQTTLFHVGAQLAVSRNSGRANALTPITAEHTRAIEAHIDALETHLPALTGFILPGGHLSAAWAHVARTVCRRAERSVVSLAGELDQGDDTPGEQMARILAFLNRLSDYFFMVARYCNAVHGVADVPWQG